MAAGQVLLEVENLRVAYGGIQAVKGINFKVAEGELVSLIGANGAGKTTTLKAVTGIQPVKDGDVRFLGKSIAGQGAWNLVKQGLVMVPEGRGTFTRMTITENLLMGAHVRTDKEVEADIEYVFTEFPRLKERAAQLAGTMSGGEQQMLAMSRALVSDPGILLLDEISMGLAPLIVAELYELVAQLAAQGISILVVEQFARTALAIAHYAAIMVQGRITRVGQPQDIEDEVSAAYLGGAA